jgi:disulfide bond formation protein DsbB
MFQILGALLTLISIATFIYALSHGPTKIDYKKLGTQLKTNFFKITTIVLFLYGAWLSIVHSNYKVDADKYHKDMRRMWWELDTCRMENRQLTARIDSLTAN